MTESIIPRELSAPDRTDAWSCFSPAVPRIVVSATRAGALLDETSVPGAPFDLAPAVDRTGSLRSFAASCWYPGEIGEVGGILANCANCDNGTSACVRDVAPDEAGLLRGGEEVGTTILGIAVPDRPVGAEMAALVMEGFALGFGFGLIVRPAGAEEAVS